jgi:hypothetical protein
MSDAGSSCSALRRSGDAALLLRKGVERAGAGHRGSRVSLDPAGLRGDPKPVGVPRGYVRVACAGVLIADDNALIRSTLTRLVGAQPDLLVVGTAANGLCAVELAEREQPHVVLLDLSMLA